MKLRFACRPHKTIVWLIAFVGAIFLLAENASAQRLSRFSDAPQDFPGEIQRVIKDYVNKEDEPIIKEFELFWNTDTLAFTLEQKAEVINISNLLLKKTSVNTRHFVTFIKIIVLYKNQDKVKSEYDAWIKGLYDYAQNDRIFITRINQFLDNSLGLFTQNTIAINPAFLWKASNNNFTINYDQNLTIRFVDTDIICTNNSDSIAILSTSGTYFPNEDKWVGKGGKVTWIRSQFPTDEIFATLKNYTINLTRNEYEADSVLFTNLDYFREPSLGKLKDKVARASSVERVVFPEFYTYTQRHRINNLFDRVNFDGGYYMLGSQFIGSGTRENPAIIEIRRNNVDFLRVEARTFIFRRQTVMSDYARVRFRLENDSLFHTGLNFNYNDDIRTVTIAPTEFLTTQSPMLSTYHNFSIKFGQLVWNIDKEEMTFGAPVGSSLGRAFFESNNYFNEQDFDALIGRDEQHPLFAIANFTNRIRSRNFNVEDFSRFVRKSVEQTRIQIMRMAMLGYVFYEFEAGEVQVLPKLYDAIRARGEFIDYDVLKFSSTIENTPNVRLNLNTFEMAINGVENVFVSDSQNVFLYPARRQLTLKKNRNFAFDGVVRAGLFTFYGNDFNFDYETFSLQLASIDSLNIDYQTDDFDFYGRRVLKKVTSTLENITGEILIDKPNNKSGLKMNEEYPIFSSTKNSFVYYDDKTIHNGVYDRENFYFEIYPFTFYNLNKFEFKDMNFKGIFYSADIFAPIEDTLILRPDNSLGFRRESPASGYAVYQGRGKFYNRIDLSNTGLRGDGRIDYITSSTTSDDLYFFPDSMRTQSKEFTIARQDAGIQYPQVIGGQHLIKWYPYQEQLYAYKGQQPFKMFHDQALLTGNLILEPLGLVGDGLMDMRKARLRSKQYAYNAIDFKTDLASVEFDNTITNELAFSSKELKAWVNFEAREGAFSKTGESIFADLPPMMYQSHMDMFTWAIDQNELTMATATRQEALEKERFVVSRMVDRDTLPSGSLFYSLHRDEDSLYFISPRAKYSLSQLNIKADSVRYLLVADAIIQPHRQRVEVDAKNRMLPLRQSKITANFTERFHNIYDAVVSVPSRKRYFGTGTIDYVDERDSIQPVKLKEIGVDNRGSTFAKGTLTQPDNFKLSPHFGFVGDFDLFAMDKFWVFDGGAQPIHPCVPIRSSNIKFKAQINPESVLIPFSERPQNINNVNLISGSVITVDSIHLYPAYVSGRKEYSDRTLVNAHGYLRFNSNRSRFQIGSLEKFENPELPGNIVSLTKDHCMLFSEGVVDIPVNLGQIKHFTTGNLSHSLPDSILNMDVVMSLNFLFNQVSLQAMASEILQIPSLPVVDLNRRIYSNHLLERLSYNEAQTAINQIRLFGTMTEIPNDMESTISFSEIRMRWDHQNRSFVSVGKLGIGTLGNTQVNRKVDGFVEIIKRNTGDWMMVYIELSPEKYYVFYYVRGSLQVSSHNSMFTDPINAMKNRDRRVRVKAGQIPFNFLVGTRRELQRARERYAELTGRDASVYDIQVDETPPLTPIEEEQVDPSTSLRSEEEEEKKNEEQ